MPKSFLNKPKGIFENKSVVALTFPCQHSKTRQILVNETIFNRIHTPIDHSLYVAFRCVPGYLLLLFLVLFFYWEIEQKLTNNTERDRDVNYAPTCIRRKRPSVCLGRSCFLRWCSFGCHFRLFDYNFVREFVKLRRYSGLDSEFLVKSR